MGNNVSDIFKFQLPDDCKCKYSDANKTGMFITWIISLLLLISMLVYYSRQQTKKFIKYIVYFLLAVLFILSIVLYFDGCSCKETSYSKFFSLGYVALTLVIIYITGYVIKRIERSPIKTDVKVLKSATEPIKLT